MDRNTNSPATRSVSDQESVSVDSDADSDLFEEPTDESNAIILDAKTSERHYWRDIRTKTEREIWQPGDGDGDRATDYWGRPIPPQRVEDRWKLYQLSLGEIKHEHNEPPKYVFLDDRACYEVLSSNIPRASLGKFWPHDFGLSGKLRDRRPHRGRGSVGDPDAEGNDKYDFTQIGIKNTIYYFTGETDFTPIIYRSEELDAEIAQKLEKKRKGWSVRYKGDPKLRGHNQFTPKEWLVKHGAPSQAKSKKKKKSVADHKVPDWLLDKPKPVDHAAASPAIVQGPSAVGGLSHSIQDNGSHANPQRASEVGAGEQRAKRRRIDRSPDPAGEDPTTTEQHSSSPSQMFPFHQQTVEHRAVPARSHNAMASIANGTHQESTCPYTQSRAYALQLGNDLAKAQKTIAEQKDKIAQMQKTNIEKEDMVEKLQRELQDLRWSVGQ